VVRQRLEEEGGEDDCDGRKRLVAAASETDDNHHQCCKRGAHEATVGHDDCLLGESHLRQCLPARLWLSRARDELKAADARRIIGQLVKVERQGPALDAHEVGHHTSQTVGTTAASDAARISSNFSALSEVHTNPLG
jgi:hypothetical protein